MYSNIFYIIGSIFKQLVIHLIVPSLLNEPTAQWAHCSMSPLPDEPTCSISQKAKYSNDQYIHFWLLIRDSTDLTDATTITATTKHFFLRFLSKDSISPAL